MAGKFSTSRERGRQGQIGTSWRTILTNKMCVSPHDVWEVHVRQGRMWGITVDRASVSCSTSSQMCGSWYLPRFLFREGSLNVHLMFLVPVPKGSSCLSNIFHYASWMVTPVPVNYLSLVVDVVLVLGSH